MAKTTTETFEGAHRFVGSVRILTVKANGGSVAIEVEHAPGVWIQADAIAVDYAGQLAFGSAAVRIVPTGGAEFMVH